MLEALSTLIAFVALLAVRHAVAVYTSSPGGAWMRRLRLRVGESAYRRYRARLSDRLTAGRDRYFEELRELKAYAPLPPSSETDAVPHYSWKVLLWTLWCAFLVARSVLASLHLLNGHT